MTSTSTANNTYTKLRDGSWGVRVQGKCSAGDSVVITKKDNTVKTEHIRTVLWSDGNVSLCSIVSTRPTATLSSVGSTPRKRRGDRYECEECGDYVEPGTRCWETGMQH